MQTNAKPTAPQPSAPPPHGKAPASVPISLYRQVAAELQAARAHIATLQAKNELLLRQQQEFVREFEVIAGAAQRLYALTASDRPQPTAIPPEATAPAERVSPPNSASPAPAIATPPVPPSPIAPSPNDPGEAKAKVEAIPPKPIPTVPAKPFTLPQHSHVRERSPLLQEGQGWTLLAVLAIVTVSFGAGYLLVKPLSPSR